jgi:cytoskeletal protein CcmA (bactofilin family)
MGWRSKSDNSRPTRDPIENILGRSCVIRGDLVAEGSFRIDGTVEGSVDSRGAVVIGESGCVRGDVTGSDVVVAGQIHGHVRCPGHLEILAKGRIEGDIDAKSVRIETGGVFCGVSRMGEMAEPHGPGAGAANDNESTDDAEGAASDAEPLNGAGVSRGHFSPAV